MQDSARTTPLRIDADRAAGSLRLEWADGHVTAYDTVTLRWLCPCAYCRGEAGMPGWLDSNPMLTAEQTRLVDIALVGSYAIQPTWGDGHDPATTRSRCCASSARATNAPRTVPGAWRTTRAPRPTGPATATGMEGPDDHLDHAVHRRATGSPRPRARSSASSSAAAAWAATSWPACARSAAARSTSTRACSRTPGGRRSTGWSRTPTLVGANARDLDALRLARSWPGRCPRSSRTGRPWSSSPTQRRRSRGE